MEKRTYKKVIDVPTEALVQEPLLVNKITEWIKGELIDGISGLMSNDNEYIVSLSDIIETQNYSGDFMSRFEQKINLVPLVRCKDCKHRIEHETGFIDCELDTGDPYELGRNAEDDNWFCKDGERREDES